MRDVYKENSRVGCLTRMSRKVRNLSLVRSAIYGNIDSVFPTWTSGIQVILALRFIHRYPLMIHNPTAPYKPLDHLSTRGNADRVVSSSVMAGIASPRAAIELVFQADAMLYSDSSVRRYCSSRTRPYALSNAVRALDAASFAEPMLET